MSSTVPEKLVEPRFPAIPSHIDAACLNHYVFFFQQLALCFETRAAFLERDPSRGSDDPVPRHDLPLRQVFQRPADLSGAARYARDFGDLSIACHAAARDVADSLVNSFEPGLPVHENTLTPV